jgi:opacity protein-like surface antigen
MLVFKKSASLLTIIMVVILQSGVVVADEHKAYLQLNAGASFTPNVATAHVLGLDRIAFDYDPGFAAGLALGYHLTERFRLEGELMYQSNDFSNLASAVNQGSGVATGERIRASFLFNGYYDFKNQTRFTPYLTAGVGGYHLEFKSSAYAYSPRNNFDVAYQVGAGVNYKICDRFGLDLKYRYFSGAEPQMKSLDNQFGKVFDVGDHQLMAGLRFSF